MLRISLLIAIVAGALGIYFTNFPIATKIKTVTTERDAAQTGKKAAEDQARKAKSELNDARTEFGKVSAELVEKSTALDAATRTATTQQARANSKEADATRFQTERNQAQALLEKFSQLNMKPEDILGLATKLKDSEKERNVFKTENEILARELKLVQGKLAQISEGTRPKVVLPPALKGEVLRVDPKYEFVVLNIGAKQGVLKGGELLVGRNGKFIAKLRVSDVQPDQSIADIITDWKFGNVMEEDQVIPD